MKKPKVMQCWEMLKCQPSQGGETALSTSSFICDSKKEYTLEARTKPQSRGLKYFL